jgi:hypothetical protein
MSVIVPNPNILKRHPNLKKLLDRDVTPNPNDITKALLELSENSMDAHDLLKRQTSLIRGLHVMRDISRLSTEIYFKHKNQNTPAFIKAWTDDGIEDDNTEQAKLLKEESAKK